MLLSPLQSPSEGEEVRIAQICVPLSPHNTKYKHSYINNFFSPCLGVSKIPIYGDKVDNWE